MQATKVSDHEAVLTRTFAAPRETVFAAMTETKHLLQWMKAGNMTLATCDVDLRAGGSFRYVFERTGGRKIEVRGAYVSVDPPRQFVYHESYDFSPLKVLVTSTFEADGNKTIFKQTLRYASKQELDEDFPGVSSSSAEAFVRLDTYLERLKK